MIWIFLRPSKGFHKSNIDLLWIESWRASATISLHFCTFSIFSVANLIISCYFFLCSWIQPYTLTIFISFLYKHIFWQYHFRNIIMNFVRNTIFKEAVFYKHLYNCNSFLVKCWYNLSFDKHSVKVSALYFHSLDFSSQVKYLYMSRIFSGLCAIKLCWYEIKVFAIAHRSQFLIQH